MARSINQVVPETSSLFGGCARLRFLRLCFLSCLAKLCPNYSDISLRNLLGVTSFWTPFRFGVLSAVGGGGGAQCRGGFLRLRRPPPKSTTICSAVVHADVNNLAPSSCVTKLVLMLVLVVVLVLVLVLVLIKDALHRKNPITREREREWGRGRVHTST